MWWDNGGGSDGGSIGGCRGNDDPSKSCDISPRNRNPSDKHQTKASC